MIREVGRAVSGEPGVTNYYVYGLDLSGTLQGAGSAQDSQQTFDLLDLFRIDTPG